MAHGNPFDASTRRGRRKINHWKEFRQYRYEKYSKYADKLKTHVKEEKRDELYIQDALLRLGPNLRRANHIVVRMVVDTLLERIGFLDVINQETKSRIKLQVLDYFKSTEGYMFTYTSRHRIKK